MAKYEVKKLTEKALKYWGWRENDGIPMGRYIV